MFCAIRAYTTTSNKHSRTLRTGRQQRPRPSRARAALRARCRVGQWQAPPARTDSSASADDLRFCGGQKSQRRERAEAVVAAEPEAPPTGEQ